MATAPRNGKREVKQRRDPAFSYDEGSLAFLATRSSNEGGCTLRHSSSDSINVPGETINLNSENIENSAINPWANIVYLNSYFPSHSHVDNENVPITVDGNIM